MSSELIYRNLSEVIGRERLDAKIEKGDGLLCYIGFAPTGKIHLGYLVPCMKIRDLTLAKCNVAIMIADVHALLDERKTPKHLVELRSDYYRKMLFFILQMVGADMRHVTFVRGSEFQMNGNYAMDVWELSSKVTISAAKKAGTEVVKQDKDPKLGSAIYPMMQAVDENYVGQAAFGAQVDMELGGLDQRKIFCFSYEHESKISYLMNPIISLAKSGKMSASDPSGKITFDDSDDDIALKIKKAFCCDADPDCGLMKMMKCVFFPFLSGDMSSEKDDIKIELDDGTKIEYKNYSDLEADFRKGVFVAPHLKKTITSLICQMISPIRDYLVTDEMSKLVTAAYS